MRLWHKDLIEYLPKSQLLAQWRELNSIYKKQDNHILINYIYNYPKDDLWSYSKIVIDELVKRNIKIKSFNNYNSYFTASYSFLELPFKNHQDNRYLLQCFYNLQEKFDRGQKDFTLELYNKIVQLLKIKGLLND